MDACSGTVGWSTVLQAGRSWVWFPMVSWELFIDIILPAALMALGSTQPLTEMSTTNIPWGREGSQCIVLTTFPSSCADCIEIWEPQTPGSLRAFPGPYKDWFIFYSVKYQTVYPLRLLVMRFYQQEKPNIEEFWSIIWKSHLNLWYELCLSRLRMCFTTFNLDCRTPLDKNIKRILKIPTKVTYWHKTVECN